jgi:hypothetical protein
MNLQDFCKKLANGRLSNTSMVEDSAGLIIKVAHRTKVIDAINEGLIRLYTRFILSEKDVVISLRDHITSYRLNSLYSESLYPQDGVEIPYILDLPGEVFSNDVIKVLAVYNHDGCELPLNNSTNVKSVFTPRFDVVQVPEPKTGELMNVVYQAKHILLTVADPLEEITLPDTLYGALEAYVAHLLFADINSDDAKIRSDKQLAKYEQICGDVILTDTISLTNIQSNIKFQNRGWI